MASLVTVASQLWTSRRVPAMEIGRHPLEGEPPATGATLTYSICLHEVSKAANASPTSVRWPVTVIYLPLTLEAVIAMSLKSGQASCIKACAGTTAAALRRPDRRRPPLLITADAPSARASHRPQGGR